MSDAEKYGSYFVKDFMTIPPATIGIDEAMESVMHKFEETNAWNLPSTRGRYVGFVSKAKIFSAYREMLQIPFLMSSTSIITNNKKCMYEKGRVWQYETNSTSRSEAPRRLTAARLTPSGLKNHGANSSYRATRTARLFLA